MPQPSYPYYKVRGRLIRASRMSVYSELLVATQAGFWAGLLPSGARRPEPPAMVVPFSICNEALNKIYDPAWFARNDPHVKALLVLSFTLASLLSGVPMTWIRRIFGNNVWLGNSGLNISEASNTELLLWLLISRYWVTRTPLLIINCSSKTPCFDVW